MLLKVNGCHVSLKSDSSMKLSVALSTKILLKKLNCLLKSMLNLRMASESIKYDCKAVSKDSPIYRDSHRSLKPAVTLFQHIFHKMGQNNTSLQEVARIFTVASFQYLLQVKNRNI